jgi:hypothetical protein
MPHAAGTRPPYTELLFGRIREVHDRVYFGRWRDGATDRDPQRAYLQLGRYPGMLADEVQRARSVEARTYLSKARKAYGTADPEAHGEAALRSLDNALSYAHSALNALPRHYRAPAHNPGEFERFSDVVAVPFQDLA